MLQRRTAVIQLVKIHAILRAGIFGQQILLVKQCRKFAVHEFTILIQNSALHPNGLALLVHKDQLVDPHIAVRHQHKLVGSDVELRDVPAEHLIIGDVRNAGKGTSIAFASVNIQFSLADPAIRPHGRGFGPFLERNQQRGTVFSLPVMLWHVGVAQIDKGNHGVHGSK